MHVYPIDYKTKEGKLFWSLPKRPPVFLDFDINDELHLECIKSFARLHSEIWGIKIEEIDYKTFINTIEILPFKPKDEEIKKI